MANSPGAVIDTATSSNSNTIKVIIVGIGIAGLAAAIECHRKGNSVTVFDRIVEVKQEEGDGITIAANGARVTAKWENGAFHESHKHRLYGVVGGEVFDHTGRYAGWYDLKGYGHGFGYTLNRGVLVSSMYNYARSLGIDIRLGLEVTDYWETEYEAGVVVKGERIAADCVVCAEGINSRAMTTINGQEPEEKETGFTATRGFLNSALLGDDPKVRWLQERTNSGKIRVWVGDNTQVHMWSKKENDGELFWYCVHEDGDSTKTSSAIDPILEAIKDWPIRDQLEPIIRKVPPQQVVSQKFMQRTPLKSWLSPGCRMIIIGDAAHTALPPAGQGGSQAIEDAAVFSIALEMAGKQNVPLALSVTEKIRYHRAVAIQRGSMNLLKWLVGTDLEEVRRGEKPLTPKYPEWIVEHDCQEYTYNEFPRVVETIKSGQKYIPHNFLVDDIYSIE
ncbi:hypothetical protein BBP40_010761 [Aspergillus hancockii]|nr:hypothetical protein BBP40_010761 [Aspergillus hancockii]